MRRGLYGRLYHPCCHCASLALLSKLDAFFCFVCQYKARVYSHRFQANQPFKMSDQQQSFPSTRTWWWIILSCVSTLVPANNTIIRPDPVLSWWKRKLLYLVLQVKTLLFPQLVLWEAVTHFICARIVRDRVNAAARQSRRAYLAAHGPQHTLTEAPEQVAPEPESSWISNLRMWLSRGYKLFFGNTVTTLRLV